MQGTYSNLHYSLAAVGRRVGPLRDDCVDVTVKSIEPGSDGPARRGDDGVRGDVRYRVLSPWTIAAWSVLIVLVGAGVAVWLLLGFTGGNVEVNRVQLDAVRTAGTIVVGTGGAAALLLAARRQRSTEIALKQKDRDQALQERVATTTEADAEARRITDLYTKAVEQLGSEKAPVRFGGLYALERLAQDHVEQRQTIVNMLCAYLRMPYALPNEPSRDYVDAAADAITPLANGVEPEKRVAQYQDRVQEREVRLTAQRLLRSHLDPGVDPDHPVATFWANIDLDLTGATLIDFQLTRCMVRAAKFDSVTFTGPAHFNSATFTGPAAFVWATFADHANFDSATFGDHADFDSATFTGPADFDLTIFTGRVYFDSATFTGSARFFSASFADHSIFRSTTFTDPYFDSAAFMRGVPVEIKPYLSPSEDAEDRRAGAGGMESAPEDRRSS